MLLFWPLVIPFATAVLCILLRHRPTLQRAVSLAGALLLLAVAVRITARVAGGGPFAEQAGGWAAPFGITLVADWLSAVMVLLTGIVAVAALVFGLADVSPEEERHGHHPLTHATLAGICGAFLTGDIFNMYVLSLIHISEPTRPLYISYAVFCLKKFFFNDTATTEIYTV